MHFKLFSNNLAVAACELFETQTCNRVENTSRQSGDSSATACKTPAVLLLASIAERYSVYAGRR